MKNVLIYSLVFVAGGTTFLIAFHILKNLGFLGFIKTINDNYASALSALSAIAMLIVAVIMCFSLIQNKKTIEINSEILELQRNDFKLRNRPIIDVEEARFGGKVASSEGIVFPYTIEMKLSNRTEITATHCKGLCKVNIDDKTVLQNKIDIGAVSPNAPYQGTVFLTEEVFNKSKQSNNKMSVDVSLNYSGVMGEEVDEYRTSFIMQYYPESTDFRFYNREYK